MNNTLELYLFKYCRYYSNEVVPEPLEGDVFKCIVSLTPQVTPEVTPVVIMQVTEQVTVQDAVQDTEQDTEQDTVQVTMQDERIKKIIEFCKLPRSREAIQKHLKLKNRDHLRKYILLPLIQKGLLRLTIPEKPRSPNQKYYTTKEKK